MMIVRKCILSAIALASMHAAAVAAPVRIDFAADPQVSVPGFSIATTGPMSSMSDSLNLGSNVPNHTNGVSFLRISSSSSSIQGADVLGYIVTMPSLLLTNIGGADGVGVDTYQIGFPSGNTGFSPWTPAGGGFAIYAFADTALTIPLLTADMTLLDRSLFLFGGSGSIESSVGLNLTNVQTPNGGNLITTLREFGQTAVLGSGASFVAGISSASTSTSISQQILARANVNGSSSGSVHAVVPEPATLLLLSIAGFLKMRRGGSSMRAN